MSFKYNLLLFILLFCLFYETVQQRDRVLLQSVSTITLERGKKTTGRRSSPVPQLNCIGGTAQGRFSPKVVQCYNRGFDGVDVQWECKAEMSTQYQFGKIEVTCEGYDYPNDPYILAGSCGLNYELDYSTSGSKKAAFGTKDNDEGINFVYMIYFLVACFLIYLIYTTLTAPREGGEGDRRSGSGFDHGPGHPPGGPQPPGWRPYPSAPPSYDESTAHGNTKANTGTSSSGPGFFSGLGLGALGGYLYGNSGPSNWFGTRRRNNYGYTQFEQNTGFSNSPYQTDYDRPSTSSGYRGNNGGSHSSTSFGGTSRR